MCSTTEARLAMIGMAIDELAEAAGNAGAGAPGTMAPDPIAERLAGIWAMVADLDPALAHRLSQYTGDA